MFRRFAIGGALVASSLAFASPALAKPSPKAIHHTRASATAHPAVVRKHAVAHANTSSSTPPALYVSTTGSDSGNTCRLASHPCKTITYALTQAAPGATIHVAAGTYPEQLTITQNVTILGVISGGGPATIIKPNSVNPVDTDPDNTSSTTYPIVDFAPGVTSGNLTDIQVNGSNAQNSITTCGQDYMGVYYHSASGTLNTDRVTGVQNPPALFGCQAGLAVYVATDTGGASNVNMKAVTVDHYQKNGITCDDVGTVCTISNSTVTGIGPTDQTAQNGIQIWNGAGSVTSSAVTGNTYTDPQYCPSTGACNGGNPSSTYYNGSGVVILDAGNVSLTSDNINANDENVYASWDPSYWGSGAPNYEGILKIMATNANNATNDSGTDPGTEKVPFGYGVGDGIDLDGASEATLHGDTAWNDPEYGFGLSGLSYSTVFGNRAGKANGSSIHYQDGDGIYIGEVPTAVTAGSTSFDNVVQSNTADNNVFDGILADHNTGDNTFKNNTLDNNGQYDAEDQSSGTNTSGTANSWTSNACLPKGDSSPLGLCTK